MSQNQGNSKKGFTLIELSIVLVIIGLIVGGVLVGQDLIKAASIRAQIAHIEEFKTAVNTFKIKYNYLPGDMPASQASQLGFFTFTGPNVGGIEPFSGLRAFANNDGEISAWSENYPFWSHLSDAKLLKGSYGGVAGDLLRTNTMSSSAGTPAISPSTASDYAKFFPAAKIGGSGAFVTAMGNHVHHVSYGAFHRTSRKSNMFAVSNHTPRQQKIFSAFQLYQIDNKMDDGVASSGNVRNARASYGDSIPAQGDLSPCTTRPATPYEYILTSATANALNCTGIDFLF